MTAVQALAAAITLIVAVGVVLALAVLFTCDFKNLPRR